MSKAWLLLISGAVACLPAGTTPSPATATWSHHSWENNVLCSATGAQYQPQAVSDNAGGAIAVRLDGRNGGSADIYARRIRADGTLGWAADVAISTGSGNPAGLRVLPEPNGGCYIVWSEDRGTGSGSNIYQPFLSPEIR